MKFQRKAFADAVQKTAKLAARRTPHDISKTLLFESRSGMVWITGTNMASRLSLAIDVEDDDEFADGFCVNAKALAIAAAQLTDDAVDIRFKGDIMSVFGGPLYKLNISNGGLFPSGVSFDSGDVSPILNQEDLATAIRGVMHASNLDVDDGRDHLAGVYCDAQHKTIVATNAERLATVGGVSGFPESFLIPISVVPLALALLDADECYCQATENAVLIFSDRAQLSFQRHAKAYPDYAQVIPEKFDSFVEVDTTALKKAVSQAMALNDDDSALLMNAQDQQVHLSVTTKKGRQAVAYVGVHGGNFLVDGNREFAFTGAYLRDAVGALDSDLVCIRFGDRLSPLMLESADGDESAWKAVIMGRRL